MKKNVLKLGVAYMDYPIWISPNDGSYSYGVEIEELNISTSLQESLERWEKSYHETFVSEDPPSSGFESYDQKSQHIQEGANLANDLQRELYDNYQVLYCPIR